MTQEHWQQIKILLENLATRTPEERKALLEQTCAEDTTMRLGVESLLSFHQQTANLEGRTTVAGFTTQLLSIHPMPPERWQQIEEIFQAAVECSADERAAFLAKACGEDKEIRREVESLLAYQAPARGFIQSAVKNVAQAVQAEARAKAGRNRSGHRSSPASEARFLPGAILAERYRVVGQLGKGGMGEVYRADDLKLGQPVALKFLTEHFSGDTAMLERFHGEVRVARQVSHPNICRVHDIGEIRTEKGNLHFLSMEYVDGEDMASLLRRIGRLPSDKAVDIARQLCAGLAAAHETGVLHRDLKPANVMIDGRGKVRITDFGLAGLADQFQDGEIRAGTPAYMSPEQISGREVTVKSDIYALGLVLYEIFTGKRVFDSDSLDDLLRMHTSAAPTNPSSHVKEIDPLVERVILRCLEKDPGLRPASALQIAAALPGGDPLQAAIAAGETPSPEMVAAAPKEGSLRPAIAVICLSVVLINLAVILLLSGRIFLHRIVPLDKSPEVLSDRASNAIRKLGYSQPATDWAYGFDEQADYLNYITSQDQSPERWRSLKAGQPAALAFWYRQSPGYLESSTDESISLNDPPPLLPGMINSKFDTLGRLIYFHAVPSQLNSASTSTAPPDWATVFNEAGLDPANFKSVEPRWLPPAYSDNRAAWEGVFPEQPQIPLRIEAASYRGLPVYFELLGPWDQPEHTESAPGNLKTKIFQVLIFVIFVLLLIGGVVLARRNWKIGRGDRKGASRLAVFAFSISLIIWVFLTHHIPSLVGEMHMLGMAAGWALVMSGVLWIAYLALEPYVRRRWPDRIIGWSRLLAGDWTNPLVGRDILIGIVLGTSCISISFLMELLNRRLGWPATLYSISPVSMRGIHSLIPGVASSIIYSLVTIMGLLLLLLLLTIFLRRNWLAAGIVWLFFTAGLVLGLLGDSPVKIIYFSAAAAGFIFVLTRFGLLAGIAAHAALLHSQWYTYTTDFSVWYAGQSIAALLIIIAAAFYGFRTSLAGQTLFRTSLLAEPDQAIHR